MDIFKAQLARLQEQLSGLTSSQKMLAAALVIIMAMSLVWWGRYAGQADLSPLLDQSFTADDMAQITSRLSAKGIQYTVSADRILVPTDRKIEILSDLGFAHLLPQKINTAFDEIVKQMTPWDTSDKDMHFWVEAKQRTLVAVIGSFPHVRDATVVIDPTSERRLDGPDITATAAVYLTTNSQDGEQFNVRQLAVAAADLVAGAEAGLSRGKVTVVVDGATIPVPDRGGASDMPDGDAIVQSIRENENMYRDKIKGALGWINGLFVSVRVDLHTARTEIAETTYDPKAVAHSSVSEEEKSTETSNPTGGAEPGASANLTANSAPTAAAGGGGAPNTDTSSKQTYANEFSHKDTRTIQPPGEAPPVSASVRVPRSYFLAMYKDKNKGADPTSDAALDAVTQTELKQIRQDVMACTGIKDEASVSTSMYDDVAVASFGNQAAGASGSSQVTRLLEGHVKDIGVGALAMVSLFMVMMMVRKSGGPSLAMAGGGRTSAESDEPTNRLQAGPIVAGEVSEGDRTMDGMELDAEAVKTQQVIEQVSSMVSENPDAAANLVKRWLNRS